MLESSFKIVGISAIYRLRRVASRGAALSAVLLLAACTAPPSYMGVSFLPGAAEPDVQALAQRARSGDKQAQLELGIRYEEGRGVPQDAKRAKALYQIAATTTGGKSYVYVPATKKGGRGHTMLIDRGPTLGRLRQAEQRLDEMKMSKQKASALLICALASCSQGSEATRKQRPDLTVLDTWLLPEEVINGRALTLAGRTGLYIRTPNRCVIAWHQQGERALPVEGLELAGLVSGISVIDKRVDPYANIEAAMGDLGKTYTPPPGQIFYRIIIGQSFGCRKELGLSASIDQINGLPDRIHIYLNPEATPPPIPVEWSNGFDVRVHNLTDGSRPYCRVALALQGNLIVKARIDAVGLKRELPSYVDYQPMDCIMRGVISTTGFTGILRYDLQDIYTDEEINSDNAAKGIYTYKLLNSFALLHESYWTVGGKI